MNDKKQNWLSEIRFDVAGLVPAIAQDVTSNRILVVAWMNQDALEETLQTGKAVYWSRSRTSAWRQGEESGHEQFVREVRLDCDGDVIILQVEQLDNIACHTGRTSCFYRILKEGKWIETDPVVKDPGEIYHRE